MTSEGEAVRLYIRAQAEQTDEARQMLADALANDAALKTPRGTFAGKAAFLEQLSNALTADNFRQASWSEPRREGGALLISGRLPVTATVGGYDLRVEFAVDGRIASVEQAVLPAPPLPPSNLNLDDEMKQTISEAWRGWPLLVACVAANGQPLLSLRGTVQPFGDDCLAFWARNVAGGTVLALETNPRLTLFYRNTQTHITYTFYGRGWVTNDDRERQVVFENSPEIERAADPERRGLAVIIELDEVEGVGPNGRVHMVRDDKGATPQN